MQVLLGLGSCEVGDAVKNVGGIVERVGPGIRGCELELIEQAALSKDLQGVIAGGCGVLKNSVGAQARIAWSRPFRSPNEIKKSRKLRGRKCFEARVSGKPAVW